MLPLGRGLQSIHKNVYNSSLGVKKAYFPYRGSNVMLHTVTAKSRGERIGRGMKNFFKIAAYGIVGITAVTYLSDSRALAYSHLLVPLSHLLLDPEEAHKFALLALRLGLTPKDQVPDAPEIETEVTTKNSAGQAAFVATSLAARNHDFCW